MRTLLMAGIAILGLGVSATYAAEFQVRMANLGADGRELVFEPQLTRINVGDTITFIPTDKLLNVESIAGMLPRGASPISGKPGQVRSITFTAPGYYGVKSASQYDSGMIGLVVVGDTSVPTLPRLQSAAAQVRLDEIMATQQ